nr:autocrine motility factor receptor [Homo sapiens]AAA79362.1 autocrine motility factor receptor [Homo sapiens]
MRDSACWSQRKDELLQQARKRFLNKSSEDDAASESFLPSEGASSDPVTLRRRMLAAARNGGFRSSRPPSAPLPSSAASCALCPTDWRRPVPILPLHGKAGLTALPLYKACGLIVFGQLINLILLCNTFYVTFLFPLETLQILTVGMISSGVDWTAWGGGRSGGSEPVACLQQAASTPASCIRPTNAGVLSTTPSGKSVGEAHSVSPPPRRGVTSVIKLLSLLWKHVDCARARPTGSCTPEQQGILEKELLVRYLEQRRGKSRAIGCDEVTPFCPTTSGTDFPSLQSKAGLISVNSGAPASHECAPWVPSPLSISLSRLDLGSG